MWKTYQGTWPRLEAIVACDEEYGIGKDGKIPWHDSEDLKHFRETTLGHFVIMGRVTFESIVNDIGHPLTHRTNVVLSRNEEYRTALTKKYPDVLTYSSLHNFLLDYSRGDGSMNNLNNFRASFKKIMIIGGEKLYREALNHPLLSYIHITKIPGVHNCDRYLPELKHLDTPNRFNTVHIIDNSDDEYLKLTYQLIGEPLLGNRTDIRAAKLFGRHLRYPLSNEFLTPIIPRLTTKYVSINNVLLELLWMLGGHTNSEVLSNAGVHIWDANTSREFLDNQGLKYEEHEAGPIYGFQWRAFGAQHEPESANTNIHEENPVVTSGNDICDQIVDLITGISENPFGRRHILTAWNPAQIKKMALPPCHMTSIFNVTVKDSRYFLNCMVVIRSNDMFLGHPYNIVQYALLTHFLIKMCNHRIEDPARKLLAGELVTSIADCHLYENHFSQIREQICGSRYRFPTIKIRDDIVDIPTLLAAGKSAIKCGEYYSAGMIKGEMAV